MKNMDYSDWKTYLLNEGVDIDSNKYPIILVEGPDGAGKSTVIDILMTIIKHTFFMHTSAPVKGSSSFYYENILNKSLDLIKVMNQPFIVDRFHIGEAVYGKIFRNHYLSYETIEKKLNILGAKQIYVTANENVLLDRLKNRGDWYISLNDVKPILKHYEKELENSRLQTFILDTSNSITKDDIKELIKFIYY